MAVAATAGQYTTVLNKVFGHNFDHAPSVTNTYTASCALEIKIMLFALSQNLCCFIPVWKICQVEQVFFWANAPISFCGCAAQLIKHGATYGTTNTVQILVKML